MAARSSTLDYRPHILFVTGGTAGHVIPMLAVMQAVLDEATARGMSLRLSYVGTAQDVQLPVIRDSVLPFERYTVRSGKLNRYITLKHLSELTNLGIGMVQAQRLVAKLRPDAVFAKGMAVSVPIAVAAARHHIPVFAHETDVRAGLANRLIARFADRIFTSFPETNYVDLPRTKLKYVGQPVRPEFYTVPSEPVVVEGRPVDFTHGVVTISGGSQGARQINRLIQEQWQAILTEASLVHLCGTRDFEQLKEAACHLPDHLRARLHLAAFVHEGVPQLYAHSRVVVGRAGGTIAELAAVGAAAILLPLSTAAQDHQCANARVLEEAGAALVLDETQVTSVQLREAILAFVREPDTLRVQGQRKAITQFARPQAAVDMAKELIDSIEDTYHGINE